MKIEKDNPLLNQVLSYETKITISSEEVVKSLFPWNMRRGKVINYQTIPPMQFCEKYKNNLISEDYTKWDKVLEKICYKFSNPNSAKEKDADIKQFIVLWWKDYKDLMEKYKTQRDLASLMGLKNRGSISLYIYRRVPTANYNKNTKRIRQWIFESTENYKCYK